MDFLEFKKMYQKKKVQEISMMKSLKPVVSICVQTFQHRDYIQECLEGILRQKISFPFEILLGEDESTDGTREICLKYAEKYPEKIRLFLHHRENNININGISTGRFNLVYNLFSAKGKYIALCEGDDYWNDPLKLQKQIQILENNQNLIGCHHWQHLAVEKEGSFVEVEAPTTGHGYYPEMVSSVKNIFTNDLRIKTRTFLFKNIIDEDFFPSWFFQVSFGDVPLSFLLGKHGDFGFIDEPMAVYRITGKGISTAGLKELGRREFNIQHFKHWIQIWDFADFFYDSKYHWEAFETTNNFLKKIIDNLPVSIFSMTKVLSYNFFGRKLSKYNKLMAALWILAYYRKIIGYRVKRKLATS